MRNASSVKDRLKNYAKKSGRTVQDALTVYCELPVFLQLEQPQQHLLKHGEIS